MRALLFTLATASLAATAAARHTSGYAASSPTWFLSAAEFGSAEDADTPLYRLRSTQGVVVEPDADRRRTGCAAASPGRSARRCSASRGSPACGRSGSSRTATPT